MFQVAASIPAEDMPSIPGGGDISKLLKSQGPVVTAVVLKAGPDSVVQEVQLDTTPQKQMVQKLLGGPFTFLGQYEDEGIMLMCRRDQNGENLVKNHHRLQPPFDEAQVQGDILLLRVAAEEEQEDESDDEAAPVVDTLAAKSNDEFFLNYCKDEYTKFAARTDIEAPKAVISADADDDEENNMESDAEENDEENVEGESDEDDDDDDDGAGFMELLVGQVIQRFQQENGRLPDESELLALKAAISQKLGGAN